MPEMGGLELVRCLRAIGFRGRVAVVFEKMTGREWRAYRDLAVSRFFRKPLEARLLALLLKSI